MQNWKTEIRSIPNLLSIFRLLLIPVYSIRFLTAKTPGDYWLAAGILLISTLTDFADGQIARKFNMVTNLGKVLDPIADKVTQFTLLICLSFRHRVLWSLIVLFIIKEGFMLVMGILNLRLGKMLDGAQMPGKLCTVILFTSMILLVLRPDMEESGVSLISAVCFAAMLLAFADYILAYFGKNKKLRDI